MPNIELTLENIRSVMREEIVAERSHTRTMVQTMLNDALAAEREHTRNMIDEAVGSERVYTRTMFDQGIQTIRAEIIQLRVMLEEDMQAESKRLTRVDRRSLKTQALLARHLAGH